MMRTVIPVFFILACMLLLGACTGNGHSQQKQVGGCSADTLPLEIDVDPSCDGGLSPVRISILSVQQAKDETYRDAASGLVALLDSLGVGICGVPRLVVISDGPCWPRHRIDFRLEKDSEKSFPAIRSALEGGILAGLSPSEERPESYGLFFIQAGVGSTDQWTLWYDGPRH
jgi:hypothetical protein